MFADVRPVIRTAIVFLLLLCFSFIPDNFLQASPLTDKAVYDGPGVPNATTFRVRIKLANPGHATFTYAPNPYNKSLVSIFQVDDSPKTIYNLMYPYLKGGTTAGGYVSQGVTSTDGAGNNLYWTISAACFVQGQNGDDLLTGGNSFITWEELATVTAPGSGLQRGFDFVNHAFGGPSLLGRDRYKQIYLNNKAAFDHLGYHPESLVVPDVQFGYRFGANEMGMDVTSQAGVASVLDGMQPLPEDATAASIYQAIQKPIFIRRNHWREVSEQTLVDEHKTYLLAAYNKSLTSPRVYNWFSHGPGEIGNENFNYYRQVIDYLKSIGGDNVIGMGLDQYLGYQRTRYAAEHGPGTTSQLTPDGYLDISFDLQNLQKTVRNRLFTLLVNSDAPIEGVEWSSNIKAVTFNSGTGLVNIQLEEIAAVDPASLPVRPTILATSPKIEAAAPNVIRLSMERPISQSLASAWEVSGNTVQSISEVPGSNGMEWKITCASDFLSTDAVKVTYRAEKGDAIDVENGLKMLSYAALPVLNQSTQTPPEEASLAISIRRDADNVQLATFNTIAEVRNYMSQLNINANISIVFNNEQTYPLASKWTLNYNNGDYTLTLRGKEGLSAFPVIDAQGLTSDPFRVDMNHLRFDRLKIRSGKYTSDGQQFGDNYSGAIISQQANTRDVKYTNLILHQGMKGIKIGAGNATTDPNISDIVIDQVILKELTGTAITVGSISGMEWNPELRDTAVYKVRNVLISNITLVDNLNQGDIEGSGAKYHGQIEVRGANHVVIRNVVADQNQKQAIRVSFSRDLLIDRCRLTNSSLNTGGGYKGAIHIESTGLVTVQNTFVQQPYESVYMISVNGLRLYYNTFDTQQSNNRGVSLFEMRDIQDVQGNLFLTKGDAPGHGPMGIGFDRGNGYIPSIQNDFRSEKNNLFATAWQVLEFNGLGSGNTYLPVHAEGGSNYTNYQVNYSRGQGSQVVNPQSVSFISANGVEGYLAPASAGRNLVPGPLGEIVVDLSNQARSYPTDAGAYDSDALTIPSASNLAGLSALTLSSVSFEPGFADSTLSYNASVDYFIASTTISATLAHPESALLVNGGTEMTISLNPGDNAVEIKVIAKDGIHSKTYTVHVHRKEHPFPFTETFMNSTARVVLGGNPKAAILTGGTADDQGAGYLRLTNNETRQLGYAYGVLPLPASQGLRFSFEYYTYGGSGGDGFTFYLFDPSGSDFQIGAPGGSMGYAQTSNNGGAPGLGNAFLGIGFDETGNFSNPIAGRQGGPGMVPSAVVIRGDGNGSALVPSNYEYLTGIQTTNASAMNVAGAGSAFNMAGLVNGRNGRNAGNVAGGLNPQDNGYRRAIVEFLPNASGNAYLVSVSIEEGHTTGVILHKLIKEFSYQGSHMPALLSYGFAAANGSLTNFHEIRNLKVTLPEAVLSPPVVSEIQKAGSENQVISFTAVNFTSKYISTNAKPLVQVAFPVLPSVGELRLQDVPVQVGQLIGVGEIEGLTFVPPAGYSGTVPFTWIASDGTSFALEPADVLLNITPSGLAILPYSESFRNTIASGLVTGGNAVLTAASGADANGAGYLRLTSNNQQQLGFARNTRAFPSGDGLSISFEYFTYGGNGADGLSFFLYDASANDAFQIGGKGGSLAYAQNGEMPGVSKAFVGFGFDEFGNFSNPTGGRIGGPGQRPGSLTLRGDGHGTGSGVPANSNYEFLLNVPTNDAVFMASIQNSAFQLAGQTNGRAGGADGLTPLHSGYRKAKIEMRPNEDGSAFIINVWITEGHVSGPIVHHLVKNYLYTGRYIPPYLSYGFGGTAGGMTNFHEVRNLEIRVPGSFEVPTAMMLREMEIAEGIRVERKLPTQTTEGSDQISATNLISMNWDGKNDYWIVRNIDKYPGNRVRVYDARGREVFSRMNYANDWDATFRGAPLPKGTYYYIIDFGQQKQMKGFISVIR